MREERENITGHCKNVRDAIYVWYTLLYYQASSLVVFVTPEEACRAVAALQNAPIDAVELMDYRALKCMADQPGIHIYAYTENMLVLLSYTSAHVYYVGS